MTQAPTNGYAKSRTDCGAIGDVMATAASPKIFYSPREAADTIGVGLTTMYSLLTTGKVRAKKIGRRTIVAHEDLQGYVRSLPDFTPGVIVTQPTKTAA